MITTAELQASLTDESRALLWRMCVFCDNWQGKLIEYETRVTWPEACSRFEKGLVVGHDGPRWSDELGSWVAGYGYFGGWGTVKIMKSPGLEHHTDPALILSVKEIVRFREVSTAYEHEAVDLYCPYDCDASGLCGWSEHAGPEYEVFCPIHSPEAYELGRSIYHSDHGFDGSHPELERQYHELTKIAYSREAAAC